jgi:hypothetical protein
MPTPHDASLPSPADEPAVAPAAERRHVHVVGSGARPPRVAAARYVSRHRLEPFHQALAVVAAAAFGPDATVVPHLRKSGSRMQLVFVVDAADPAATVDYAAFLPREQAFWTAYANVAKPDVPFAVAVRPARGWCRLEALAPFFAYMPVADDAM